MQGISGAAAVNDVDGTFKTVFDAVGIKDRAGNWLAANQSSAETQFTIILGDVELDYGDHAERQLQDAAGQQWGAAHHPAR